MTKCPVCKGEEPDETNPRGEGFVRSEWDFWEVVDKRSIVFPMPSVQCTRCKEQYLTAWDIAEADRLAALALSRVLPSGKRFKIMREAMGLSLDWATKTFGVSARTIKRWESGKAPMDPDVYEELAGIVQRSIVQRAHVLPVLPTDVEYERDVEAELAALRAERTLGTRSLRRGSGDPGEQK